MSEVVGVNNVLHNLEAVLERALLNAEVRAEVFAAELEVYDKQNRPWHDRTGNARRSITGSSERTPTVIRVAQAIGVNYGRYLELSNGRRFAIIEPSQMVNRNRWPRAFVGILKGF